MPETKTTFVNLTEHEIAIYRDGDIVLRIPPSGDVARLIDSTGPAHVPPVGGIPAVVAVPLEARRLEGLPPPRSGVAYVTSVLCLSAARALGRLDVVAPDTDAGGAVRDGAGRLVGTTRLVLAGDERPAYRLVFGSATVPGAEPRDLDVLGWGGGPVLHTPSSGDVANAWGAGDVDRIKAEGVEARARWGQARAGEIPVDYHPRAPELRGAVFRTTPDGDVVLLDEGGYWVVRVPVWDEEDPSSPVLLWHSPCARPVRVEREVLRTGPALLRRLAATGLAPEAWCPEVELSASSDEIAPTYRGSGLVAWRTAAERAAAAGRLDALPEHVRELCEALLRRDELALCVVEQHADAAAAIVVSGAARSVSSPLLRDAAGAAAACGRVFFLWDGDARAWRAPYARGGWSSFEALLAAWGDADSRDLFERRERARVQMAQVP